MNNRILGGSTKLKVLHINFSDLGGGAEEFARSISAHQGNVLMVKIKRTDDTQVKEIPKGWSGRIFTFLDKITWKAGFKRSFRSVLGIQDEFHSSYNHLRKLKCYKEADLIHLHNIHGEFFDIKSLAYFGKAKPLVWTSHDMWLLTGGEGFVFDGMTHKERLNSYPLRNPLFDRRKHYIGVKKILLEQKIRDIRIIAPSVYHEERLQKCYPKLSVNMVSYGIDMNTFYPSGESKSDLANILVFSSQSIYKRSAEVIRSIRKVGQPFHLHVIGDPIEEIAEKQTNHGFIQDRKEIAELFQKIDIAAFASNEETFGLLPAEVAACGAKIFLNDSLKVFHEHEQLYEAKLFSSEADLSIKISTAINNLQTTREEGLRSAEFLRKRFDRL
jgi:glycosyltransferase involved in cell wall biosynthesis